MVEPIQEVPAVPVVEEVKEQKSEIPEEKKEECSGPSRGCRGKWFGGFGRGPFHGPFHQSPTSAG